MNVDDETGPLAEGRILAEGRSLQRRYVGLAAELIFAKAVEKLAEFEVLRLDAGEQLRHGGLLALYAISRDAGGEVQSRRVFLEDSLEPVHHVGVLLAAEM